MNNGILHTDRPNPAPTQPASPWVKTLARLLTTLALPLAFIGTLNTAHAVDYQYDKLNRLISATYDNGRIINYTYDKAGNILSIESNSHLAIPSNITATKGTYSDKVILNWDPVPDVPYTGVVRCTSVTGRECESSEGSAAGSTIENTFWDGGVTPGQVYYYYLTTCEQTMCGIFSHAIIGYAGNLPSPLPDVPPAPDAGDGLLTNAIDMQVYLGSDETARWYRCDEPDSGRCKYIGRGAGIVTSNSEGGVIQLNTNRDVPVTPNKAYYYRVRACNDIGCTDMSPYDVGFAGTPVTLTVEVVGEGQVVSSPPGIDCPYHCSVTLPQGTRLDLQAIPGDQQVFLGWGAACGFPESCVVTLDSSRTVEVRFTDDQYVPDTLKLDPWSTVGGGRYGTSVAIDGRLALIGSEFPDGGRVLVAELGEDGIWRHKTALLGGGSGKYYGYSVALEGNLAVIGAPPADGATEPSWGVHVVELNPETGFIVDSDSLVAGSGPDGGQFGWSVAISGDSIVVGAPREDNLSSDTGAAYVFEKFGSDWVQTAKLRGSDTNLGHYFGKSVAVSGNTILVGAPNFSSTALMTGKAYLFEKQKDGTWSETEQLVSTDIWSFDLFGSAVALQGDRALVGAPGDGNNVTTFFRPAQKDTALPPPPPPPPSYPPGAAYLFEKNGVGQWGQVAKLEPSLGGHAGASVALDGDLALVGVPDSAIVNVVSGSAALFQEIGGSWRQVSTLLPNDPGFSDQLGHSVAIQGDIAVVGAPGDDDQGADSGTAYFFDIGLGGLVEIEVGEGGTVSWVGGGCGGVCTQYLTNGQQLVLNAMPRAGYEFVRWEGACSSSGSCTLTGGGQFQFVQAVFETVSTTYDCPLWATGIVIDHVGLHILPELNGVVTLSGSSSMVAVSIDGVYFVSGECISTFDSVTIEPYGRAEFVAPVVMIGPGFHAREGSNFYAGSSQPVTDASSLVRSRSEEVWDEAEYTEEPNGEIVASVRILLEEAPYRLLELLTSLGASDDDIDALVRDSKGEVFVFESRVDLVADDGNGVSDIYRYDDTTGELSLISRGLQGSVGNGVSRYPVMDAVGSTIAFQSLATNLTGEGDKGHPGVFVYRHSLGALHQVSLPKGENMEFARHPSLDGAGETLVLDAVNSHGDTVIVEHVLAEDESGVFDYVEHYADTERNLHHPAIDSEGRFLAYVAEDATGVSCNLRVIDRESGGYFVVGCPGNVQGQMDTLRLEFSPSGETILWQVEGLENGTVVNRFRQ